MDIIGQIVGVNSHLAIAFRCLGDFHEPVQHVHATASRWEGKGMRQTAWTTCSDFACLQVSHDRTYSATSRVCPSQTFSRRTREVVLCRQKYPPSGMSRHSQMMRRQSSQPSGCTGGPPRLDNKPHRMRNALPASRSVCWARCPLPSIGPPLRLLHL